MDAFEVPFQLGDWSSGHGPLYRRLADGIREAVRQGDLGAGSRLPSERDVARDLDISRTTVIAAYRLLRDEGLLESARGSGTRVARSGRWIGPAVPSVFVPASKPLRPDPDDIVDISGSVGTGLEGLPDGHLQLTSADLRGLAETFRYEPLGLPDLRAEIAARYTRLGLPTTLDEVLITSGAQQAVELLFTLFGRDHGTVVTENPTYAGALDAARAAGATVIGLPVDQHGIRVHDLRQTLDRSPVRLIYLMATCQNPTGVVMSAARRRDVLRLAGQARVPVVDDSTLADLTLAEGPQVPLMSGPDAAIAVGSLSKLFWAGLRVGWIRASGPILSRLARLKVIADLGSSHVSQLLAIRLLSTVDDAIATRRRQLVERLDVLGDLLSTHLPTWSWTRPKSGPYLWVRLPHGNADQFGHHAVHYGVRVLPGTRTSPDDSFADHVRLSFVEDVATLRTAVLRLRQAWASFDASMAADRVVLDVMI